MPTERRELCEPPVRVAALSDDRLLCDSLLHFLATDGSFDVVGQGVDAILSPALAARKPEVLLVDSRLPGALALCSALGREGNPAVLLVAAPDEDAWALEAILAGARGIFGKSTQIGYLPKAIRVVHEGQLWARRRLIAQWMDQFGRHVLATRADGETVERLLSSRERDVFRIVAAGLGNKEVAGRLAISEATVKTHLTHIFQKLGLRGRGELAAAFHGVVPLAAGPIRPPRLRRPA